MALCEQKVIFCVFRINTIIFLRALRFIQVNVLSQIFYGALRNEKYFYPPTFFVTLCHKADLTYIPLQRYVIIECLLNSLKISPDIHFNIYVDDKIYIVLQDSIFQVRLVD